jgi:hypothetical protein
MACGPKEYRAHAESCLRRARTVRNPILAEEFEKLAQSWLRLAKAADRDGLVVQLRSKKWDEYRA